MPIRIAIPLNTCPPCPTPFARPPLRVADTVPPCGVSTCWHKRATVRLLLRSHPHTTAHRLSVATMPPRAGDTSRIPEACFSGAMLTGIPGSSQRADRLCRSLRRCPIHCLLSHDAASSGRMCPGTCHARAEAADVGLACSRPRDHHAQSDIPEDISRAPPCKRV